MAIPGCSINPSILAPANTLSSRSDILMNLKSPILAVFLCGILLARAYADDSSKPAADGNGDIVIGPDYKLDPDLSDKGNPKGKSFEFSMALADSKVFRGDDTTLDPKKDVRKERKIFVYVPAAYKD